jgi:hypothetical protein
MMLKLENLIRLDYNRGWTAILLELSEDTDEELELREPET